MDTHPSTDTMVWMNKSNMARVLAESGVTWLLVTLQLYLSLQEILDPKKKCMSLLLLPLHYLCLNILQSFKVELKANDDVKRFISCT